MNQYIEERIEALENIVFGQKLIREKVYVDGRLILDGENKTVWYVEDGRLVKETQIRTK